MSLLLYRISHFCTRHKRIVFPLWLLLLVGVVVGVKAVGGQTSNNLTLPGTGSTEATDLLDENLPKQANGTNPGRLRGEQRQGHRRHEQEGDQGREHRASEGARRREHDQPASRARART